MHIYISFTENVYVRVFNPTSVAGQLSADSHIALSRL